MGQTPDEIRNEIEATRADLRDDVDRIADRTSPKRIAQRRTDRVRSRAHDLKERVMGAAPDRETFHEAGQRAQETAHTVRDSVKGTAEQAAETVRSVPGQTARQTQGNPLAAGLIAFGVGLLAGSVISESQAERRAARRLKEQMGGAVEPVKQSVMESAQRVKEDARESAQHAAGQVKESAAEAGQATRESTQEQARQVTEQARGSARR